MDPQQPLSCGLRGTCKSALQGMCFPASEADAEGTPRPELPADIVRLIDATLRSGEREERLRAMHRGDLWETLHKAAGAGGLHDVRFLIAAGAYDGATDGLVVAAACRHGHRQVAEVLLDASRSFRPLDLEAALFDAAYGGHTACCKMVLERGADIHVSYDAPLRFASSRGHLETVSFLLSRGANVKALSEQAM